MEINLIWAKAGKDKMRIMEKDMTKVYQEESGRVGGGDTGLFCGVIPPTAEKNMGKHTPGPWTVQGRKIHHLQFEEPLRETNLVASIPNNNPESIANATLIAAAPDMYEALKNVIAYHREYDSGEGELFGLDFVTTCIAAVRKVEGK